MPVTWRAYIDSRTAQMKEEIRALKRKSKIGEIGLKATEQRSHLLERHVRLVLILPTGKGGKFLKKLWCCVGGSITR